MNWGVIKIYLLITRLYILRYVRILIIDQQNLVFDENVMKSCLYNIITRIIISIVEQTWTAHIRINNKMIPSVMADKRTFFIYCIDNHIIFISAIIQWIKTMLDSYTWLIQFLENTKLLITENNIRLILLNNK